MDIMSSRAKVIVFIGGLLAAIAASSARFASAVGIPGSIILVGVAIGEAILCMILLGSKRREQASKHLSTE
jgi:hypothetical protein